MERWTSAALPSSLWPAGATVNREPITVLAGVFVQYCKYESRLSHGIEDRVIADADRPWTRVNTQRWRQLSDERLDTSQALLK